LSLPRVSSFTTFYLLPTTFYLLPSTFYLLPILQPKTSKNPVRSGFVGGSKRVIIRFTPIRVTCVPPFVAAVPICAVARSFPRCTIAGCRSRRSALLSCAAARSFPRCAIARPFRPLFRKKHSLRKRAEICGN